MEFRGWGPEWASLYLLFLDIRPWAPCWQARVGIPAGVLHRTDCWSSLSIHPCSSCLDRAKKSRCQQGWFLLEACGENLFPGLFPLLMASCIPWLMAPSSVFKAHGCCPCFHHHIAVSSSVVKFPSYKHPFDLGLTWIHHDNLPYENP